MWNMATSEGQEVHKCINSFQNIILKSFNLLESLTFMYMQMDM